MGERRTRDPCPMRRSTASAKSSSPWWARPAASRPGDRWVLRAGRPGVSGVPSPTPDPRRFLAPASTEWVGSWCGDAEVPARPLWRLVLVVTPRHRVVAARGNEARLGCVDVSAAVPGSNVECSLRRGISGSDALHVRSGLAQTGAGRSRDGRARSTDAHRAFSATSRDRSGNIS